MFGEDVGEDESSGRDHWASLHAAWSGIPEEAGSREVVDSDSGVDQGALQVLEGCVDDALAMLERGVDHPRDATPLTLATERVESEGGAPRSRREVAPREDPNNDEETPAARISFRGVAGAAEGVIRQGGLDPAMIMQILRRMQGFVEMERTRHSRSAEQLQHVARPRSMGAQRPVSADTTSRMTQSLSRTHRSESPDGAARMMQSVSRQRTAITEHDERLRDLNKEKRPFFAGSRIQIADARSASSESGRAMEGTGFANTRAAAGSMPFSGRGGVVEAGVRRICPSGNRCCGVLWERV